MSDLDAQLRSRQKSGLGWMIVGGLGSAVLVIGFILWLFVIKGHAFDIKPDDAAVTAKLKVNSGTATIIGGSLYRLGSGIEVEVSADEFISQSVTVGSASPNTIAVTLSPKPGVVTASISNQTQGEPAAWFLDGKPLAQGNPVTTEIAPGDYELRVTHPFYEPYSQPLSVKRASTQDITVELTPVVGSALLQSTPTGAQVMIDGQQMGVTPLQLPLQGGAYQTQITLFGYEPVEERLVVEQNSRQPMRNYQLIPLQATLDIQVQPVGGTLLLNGATASTGKNSVDANKDHLVTYTKPGYTPFRQTVNLTPKAEQRLTINLPKSYGKVTIKSNVDAEVTVNGNAQGRAPNTLSLQTLPQTISLSKPGYRSVTKTVTPKAGQTQQLDVKLLTEFDARRAEGKPLFADTLGIKMRKFRPTAFTMGSPPNEAGRQRNEHQLKVSFDYSLWVGIHEITETQYAAFVTSHPKSTLPVTNITWADAAKFSNWLSEKEALTPVYNMAGNRLLSINYDADGYRLPTEAEWEWLAKKARRATETPYVWGSAPRIPRDAGNFADKSLKGTQPFFFEKLDDNHTGKAPVGSYKADRNGLHDLAGNVSEWVQDFYTNAVPDLSRTYTNYTGAKRGQQHVVKGANFQSGRLKNLRAGLRTIGEGANDTTGFRLVRRVRERTQ